MYIIRHKDENFWFQNGQYEKPEYTNATLEEISKEEDKTSGHGNHWYVLDDDNPLVQAMLQTGGTVEKKRKATVKYRRTADGQNKIIALEGFLTSEEVKALGTEIYRLWHEQDHRMYAESASWVDTKCGGIDAKTDKIYTDANFSALIAEMKACGKVLSQIIKDVRVAELAEIKVIEI